MRSGAWTSNWTAIREAYFRNTTDIPSNIDTMVNTRVLSLRADGYYDSMSQIVNAGATININTQTMWANWPGPVTKADIILEYTKTTD